MIAWKNKIVNTDGFRGNNVCKNTTDKNNKYNNIKYSELNSNCASNDILNEDFEIMSSSRYSFNSAEDLSKVGSFYDIYKLLSRKILHFLNLTSLFL